MDDQSGNGNNAVQTTTGNQPAFVSGALNGNPAIQFNSAANTYLAIPNASTLSSSQVSIIAVARRTSGTGVSILGCKFNGSNYPYYFGFTGTSPLLALNSSAVTLQGTLGSSTYGILEGVYNQVTAQLFVNGSLAQSAAYTTALYTNTGPLYLGAIPGSQTVDGQIAEVLVYNTALSTAQRQQVEAYLYQKYGVGTQPTAPSPSLSVPQGVYSGTQMVTLTPGQSGDTIYYTTNGTTPTTSSTVYTTPLTVSRTTTINMIEAASGYTSSPVVSTTYTIDSTSTFTRTGLVEWLRADVGVVQSSGAGWDPIPALGHPIGFRTNDRI